MVLRGANERFSALTGALDRPAWRWLGAIAVERGLGRSVLAKLSAADVGALDAWLGEAVGSGLLVTAGPGRALGLTVSEGREPGFLVHPEHEQVVLRELAGRDELHAIALETRALLDARSLSDLAVALQDGDLGLFLRRFSAQRPPRPTPLGSAAEWLRLSLCAPFDAAWLERVWGDEAMTVAARVLRESLDGPSPCAELTQWVSGRLAQLESDEQRLSLQDALCQHALLRGNAAVNDLVSPLPLPTGLGYRAAARFIDGDLPTAQALLDQALGKALGKAVSGSGAKSGTLPQCGAVTPILALLLCARDTPAASVAAKRLLAQGSGEGERGAARAFRTLLRYLGQPEAHHRRIDLHQLEASAGAWEILLTALTVHLHLGEAPSRARWSQHLVRKAVAWQEGGHAWLSKQALLLAHGLSAEYCEQELGRHGMDVSAVLCRPRELSLWELVAPKPEWKKTLQALSEVSEVVTESAERRYRVAWYMDMADGSFSRPALQEYRPVAGGWSQGQRLSLAQLHEVQQGLPPEDLKVLACSHETLDGRRELAPEAHEMLIGHPRVFNGLRGMAAVEVVRGSCRIETEEEGGYIRVVVEPQGAELGVNVVPQGDGRLVIYRVTEAMRRVIEVLPQGVRIPKAHEPEVLQVLARLAQTVEVRSPHLGAERNVAPDSTPCLRIAPSSGAWLVQLGVRPFGAKGRFFGAGVGRVSVTLFGEGKRLRCERDFEVERSRADQLIAECKALSSDPEARLEGVEAGEREDRWMFGEEEVLVLLSELRDAKSPCELEWPESTALRLRGTVSSKSLNGRLRCIKGWYLATGGVRLDEVTEVALNDLVRAPVLMGGRFLRLASGDYVEVEKRIRRVVAALAATSSGKRKGGELAIHPGEVATLQELADPDSGFEVDGEARAWLERVEQLASKSFPVPASLRAELRPYQVEGFRWLCRLAELGLGACLADDMGLGKTLQILALLLTRTGGPALVVAPTSVCSNWAIEMRRFAPALAPLEYTGKDRTAELAKAVQEGAGRVVICSYALLQQDEAQLAAVAWDTVVLDEAQFIKSSESLRARAAFRLQARQRIAATGTPVENHPGDLWSIFHFLNPGLLGDWAYFNRRFVKPIQRDGDVAPQAVLRRMVKPYVLRRLKRDVLPELPPLTEVQHEVELSHDDALRYGLLRKQIHQKLFTVDGKQHNKIEVLAEITRLRRFCCHPRLVFPDASSESAKIQAFLDLVEELRENQHRALVFSQYVDFLDLVREQLDERAIRYEYLDGSTPKARRQARVDAFQNGSAELFLISLKAGGFGLNLTAADYVIHLDPWWNPAVEAQASDRAHRIGQERRVTVYRLVTKDTIEEKILELHSKKQRLARALLDGGEEAGSLSTEELVRLIEGDGQEG